MAKIVLTSCLWERFGMEKSKRKWWCGLVFLLVLAPSGGLWAQGEPAEAVVDSGHAAWMMTASALVLLMTPGLAFFYGGLVRRKNVLSVLMQCFICMCLVSILWVVIGYSLAFGDTGTSSFIGNLDHLFLKGVGPDVVSGGIPTQLFMVFQGMFAIITPALILGAYAERMKFSGFVVFTGLWLLLVYCPVCHWVWCNLGEEHVGFWGLGAAGALDFAGGTVVHINAGIAALMAALVLGKRQGYPDKISPPHNLPFAVLGAGLLWFGWFGFNAGSALASNASAVNAFVVTHVATAAAGLAWAIIESIRAKATVLGVITGAVAGLVAITPCSGSVDAMGAIGVGIGASVFAYIAVAFVKTKLGYDDSLDVFGVHGIAGIWGALAAGIFATSAVPGNDTNGGLYGNWPQLGIQAKAVLYTLVYSGVVSFILLKLVDLTIGLKVSEHEERVGLDLTDHAETAYTIMD